MSETRARRQLRMKAFSLETARELVAQHEADLHVVVTYADLKAVCLALIAYKDWEVDVDRDLGPAIYEAALDALRRIGWLPVADDDLDEDIDLPMSIRLQRSPTEILREAEQRKKDDADA